MQRPQAAGADLDLDLLAVPEKGQLVDVGEETGLGVAVGVADVVAGHPGFQAEFASHGWLFPLAPERSPQLIATPDLVQEETAETDAIFSRLNHSTIQSTILPVERTRITRSRSYGHLDGG